MEILLFGILGLSLLVVFWFVRTVWGAFTNTSTTPTAESSRGTRSAAATQQAKTTRVGSSSSDIPSRTPKRKPPEVMVDLRGSNPVRWNRVVGTSYFKEAEKLRFHEERFFLLNLEPENSHDENAIAVYSNIAHKVGYISAASAAKLSPLLAPHGSWFVVQRNYEDYTADKAGIPYLTALKQLSGPSTITLNELRMQPKRVIPRAASLRSVTGKFPRIGSVYKDGSVIYGYTTGYASELRAKGTPLVSSSDVKGFIAEIQKVRIDDLLEVNIEKGEYIIRRGAQTVGRLRLSPDEFNGKGGTLRVQTLKIGPDKIITNFGGVFFPA